MGQVLPQIWSNTLFWGHVRLFLGLAPGNVQSKFQNHGLVESIRQMSGVESVKGSTVRKMCFETFCHVPRKLDLPQISAKVGKFAVCWSSGTPDSSKNAIFCIQTFSFLECIIQCFCVQKVVCWENVRPFQPLKGGLRFWDPLP